MDDRSFLLDTNVLLEATTPARKLHQRALTVVNEWPNRGLRLCVSGQVLREYLVVATRSSELNGLGLSVAGALANVAAFVDRCRFLTEGRDVHEALRRLLGEVECSGKQTHDANLVATCLANDVKGLVTANVADFQRFGDRIELRPLKH